jgi:hypothetical protein
VKDAEGKTEVVEHKRHGFAKHGQRYERVLDLMPPGTCRSGPVGNATLYVLEARAMWDVTLSALEKNALCLVDEVVPGSEGHNLVIGSSGKSRYVVGPSPEDSEKRRKTDESCGPLA